MHLDQVVAVLAPRLGSTCYIRTLNLDHSAVRNPAAFARLFNDDLGLRHLSLRHNAITDDAVREYAAQLKSNKLLATLSLFNNQIGTAGAEYIADVRVYYILVSNILFSPLDRPRP